ncbi:uncharacterized protein LOC134181136 [Corticium candelabrum]|nr:uncharacterized protein LOC134181136 [Corticium candelabrum]
MINQVFASFPDIAFHVFKMYSGFGDLIVSKGSSTVKISSQEGVHQGDPLGPVLFSIAIHPLLLKLQSNQAGIMVLAYLDDIFLLGPPNEAMVAFENLRSDFSSIGLEISSSKCEVFSSSSGIKLLGDQISSIPTTSTGTTILGVPIGCPSFIQSHCSSFADSGNLLCDQLVELEDPQSAMLLLRHCHVPRMTHLARSVAPKYLIEAASLHDHLTRESFSKILNCGPIPNDRWFQATLPIKNGGFGMTSITEICQIAFISSWANALSTLPIRFPAMENQINEIIFGDGADGSIRSELLRAIPPGKIFTDLLEDTKRLQQKLTRQHMSFATAHMVENTASPRDAARLRSLGGKGAGSWLNTIPESAKFALSPYEFRLACLLRLGLSLPAVRWIEQCDCGTALDEMGYHLLTCKKGGGPVWSHDSIVSEWDDCLRQLQIHHKKEPRDRYNDSNNRPDIAVFDVGSGANVELDVALSHPWASDIVSQAAEKDGAAAARREDRKTKKYSELKLAGMSSMRFVPLVMEHFGRWGEEATKYLQELSRRSCDDAGNNNCNEFMCFWRKRFSITLQRCNAKTIAKKISILTFNSCNTVDDFVTQFYIH